MRRRQGRCPLREFINTPARTACESRLCLQCVDFPMIRNRMTYLLRDIDRKNAVIFAGICVSAMMQPTGDQRQQRGDRAQPRVEVTVRID